LPRESDWICWMSSLARPSAVVHAVNFPLLRWSRPLPPVLIQSVPSGSSWREEITAVGSPLASVKWSMASARQQNRPLPAVAIQTSPVLDSRNWVMAVPVAPRLPSSVRRPDGVHRCTPPLWVPIQRVPLAVCMSEGTQLLASPSAVLIHEALPSCQRSTPWRKVPASRAPSCAARSDQM